MPGKPYITLVNINKNKGMPYDVYIGRSSYTKNFWGNDFVIGINGNRATVIEKFERKLLFRIAVSKEVTYDHFLGLRGKTLGCHCVPKRCHGDVIGFYVKLACTMTEEEFYAICNVRHNSKTIGGFDKCY